MKENIKLLNGIQTKQIQLIYLRINVIVLIQRNGLLNVTKCIIIIRT